MLFRDALVTIVTRFGLAAMIFGTDVTMAHLLGPTAKGRFTLVLLFSQLLALVLAFGLDNALGVVAARSRDIARRGFGNALGWSLVVGGVAALGAAWLFGIPGEGPSTGPLTQLIPNLTEGQFLYAAIAIPFELFFAIALFGLLGRKQIVAYNGIRLLRRGVMLILFLAMAAIARLNLQVALVLNVIALLISSIAIVLVANRSGTFSLRPDLVLLREQLAFGVRSVGGSVAERLQFRIDAFLVNALVGVTATGVYSVATGLAETLWYLPNALGLVMFSRAVDRNTDPARVAAVLSRTTIFTTLVLAAPVFVVAPWLTEVIYGPAFVEAGTALRALLPGVVAYSVVAILSRYVVGQGNPGLGTAVLVAGLIVNVVANLLLVPQLGILGAALASTISYFVTASFTVLAFRRLSTVPLREILLLQRRDLRAPVLAATAAWDRMTHPRRSHARVMDARGPMVDIVVGEHEPGEER